MGTDEEKNPVETDKWKSPVIGDGLMDFRTVWLRAVALAWMDNEFRAQLLSEQVHAEDVIESRFKDFSWPWKGCLTLRVHRAPGFLWIGDDWVWPSAPLPPSVPEGLILYVPLTPPTTDATLHAAALADYYQTRPSLLVTSHPNLMNTSLVRWNFNVNPALADLMSDPPSPVVGSISHTGSRPPKGGFIPTDTDFANFEVALLYAMSKAWENDAFRVLLQADGEFGLSTCHGYGAPWSLSLRIRDDPTAKWTPQGGPAEKWKLGSHILDLNLPEAPAAANERSIALASYNATGAEYPFTCCA